MGFYTPSSSGSTDGWMSVSETWTRTGNYTFTVSGDLTAKYKKGTLVRYKDGGSYEYGIVASSSYGAPNTTVTLITNTDYAMAAVSITDTYISYEANPQGFPAYFNYTPTIGANAGVAPAIGNGTIVGKYKVVGTLVFVDIVITFGTTSTYGSGGSFYTVTLPVAAGFAHNQGLPGWYSDYSTWKHWLGNLTLDASTNGNMYYDHSTGTGYVYATTPFTMSTSDQLCFGGSYLM